MYGEKITTTTSIILTIVLSLLLMVMTSKQQQSTISSLNITDKEFYTTTTTTTTNDGYNIIQYVGNWLLPRLRKRINSIWKKRRQILMEHLSHLKYCYNPHYGDEELNLFNTDIDIHYVVEKFFVSLLLLLKSAKFFFCFFSNRINHQYLMIYQNIKFRYVFYHLFIIWSILYT